MATQVNEEFLYSFTFEGNFKGNDGEHVATLNYTGWNDKQAKKWADHYCSTTLNEDGTPALKLLTIERSSAKKHAEIEKRIADANPSRVPLDEKTDGNPNRVASDPSLAAKDE